MKLTLEDSRYLKDSINVISELVNEVNFKVAKDRVELIAMDPANVAMVVFKLLSSAFTVYDVKGENYISVSLDSLKSILKRAKSTDVLSLELDEDKNRLIITLEGDNVKKFDIALIDTEDKEQKIPTLDFGVKIEMEPSLFNELVEDIGTVSDNIILKADKNKLIVNGEGSLSSAKIELNSGKDANIISNTGDVVKAKYSIEYMKKIVKGSKLSDSVTLYFDRDYPLKVEYKIIDKLSLTMILAPRVSND